MEKKTSLFENGLIWFGAGVSIAEILTGTYFAPLGMAKGLAAILIGHVIGCVLLFLSGVIGGRLRKSAMETVKDSFGIHGGQLFAILNVLQLAGWTAIMIYDGALAAREFSGWSVDLVSFDWCFNYCLDPDWNHQSWKIQYSRNGCPLYSDTYFSKVIFFNGTASVVQDEAMSFGAAVELAVAMPLSWLPLISDYTREAKQPVKATAVSAIVYGIVSCFMYLIGMGASIFTGESDIAQIMVKAGLGAAGLLIVVFSTVTTTFLDAYSAGISSESIVSGIKGNYVAIAITIIGTIAAIVYPMDDITNFLYLIGSVFAPMIAIQIADFYILKRKSTDKPFQWRNLFIWLIGFIMYRILMRIDIVCGNTLPDMLLTIALCLIAAKIVKEKIKILGRQL